jgi:flagellar hook-basal body complex protein FliE
MSIEALGAVSDLAALPSLPSLPAAPAAGVDAGFGALMTQGLERLEGLHDTSDALAVQAATGDLRDIHDYMIASTQSSVATELTVAVRNKAVEAFSEIMRMQV